MRQLTGRKLGAAMAIAITVATLAIPGTAQADNTQGMPTSPRAAAAAVPDVGDQVRSTPGVQTHEWKYDGPFPDPWSCRAWGEFGLNNGWWAGWWCQRTGFLPPIYILFVRPYH
jgi:hypothetical protein